MEILKEYISENVTRRLCLVKKNDNLNYLFNEQGLYVVSKYSSTYPNTIVTKIGIDENILISNIDSCSYINIPNRNILLCSNSFCDHKIGCNKKYYRCNESNDNKPVFYICPITLSYKRV